MINLKIYNNFVERWKFSHEKIQILFKDKNLTKNK
jgi:hypothetical protein